jgi:hypothetical protein
VLIHQFYLKSLGGLKIKNFTHTMICTYSPEYLELKTQN